MQRKKGGQEGSGEFVDLYEPSFFQNYILYIFF